MSSGAQRALITGGAGVIGSHLTDALLAAGSRVTVLDDLSTGKLANLPEDGTEPLFTFVRGDVRDADLVNELVRDHEIVYHLAAAVGVKHIVDDPLNAVLTNVQGTENVLAAGHRFGPVVLVASTSEIYGKSSAAPFREDGERVLGPTWVHRWSYSTAKAIDEHLAFAYAEKGLRVVTVRYFNTYGPRIDERGYGSVIARFAAQALAGEPLTVHGDGLQSRCFTYVDDTVRGTVLAATTPAAYGRVFNVGSSEEVRVVDLARLIQRLVSSGSRIEHVPYESYYGPGFEDTRRRVPDVRRAHEVLGFEARVPLADGLDRTLAWCRAHYAAGIRA